MDTQKGREMRGNRERERKKKVREEESRLLWTCLFCHFLFLSPSLSLSLPPSPSCHSFSHPLSLSLGEKFSPILRATNVVSRPERNLTRLTLSLPFLPSFSHPSLRPPRDSFSLRLLFVRLGTHSSLSFSLSLSLRHSLFV